MRLVDRYRMFPGKVDPSRLVEVKEPYRNRPRGKLPLGWAWLALLRFLYRMGDVLGRVLSLLGRILHVYSCHLHEDVCLLIYPSRGKVELVTSSGTSSSSLWHHSRSFNQCACDCDRESTPRAWPYRGTARGPSRTLIKVFKSDFLNLFLVLVTSFCVASLILPVATLWYIRAVLKSPS